LKDKIKHQEEIIKETKKNETKAKEELNKRKKYGLP